MGSSDTVSVVGIAGEATTPVTALAGAPLVGVLKVIHFAPEVAVNEIGKPLVESTTFCEVTVPGAAKARAVQLNVKLAGGAVTLSVIGTFSGLATPETVTVMDAAL